MLRKCSYTSQTSTTKVLGRLTKTQWFEGILTRNTPYWARFAHLHNAIHNSLLITELHTWQVLQIYSHFYICTDYIALQTCVRTYVRTAMPCPVAEKFADPSLLAIFGTYSGWDLYTFPSVWSVSDTYMYVNGSNHYWVWCFVDTTSTYVTWSGYKSSQSSGINHQLSVPMQHWWALIRVWVIHLWLSDDWGGNHWLPQIGLCVPRPRINFTDLVRLA